FYYTNNSSTFIITRSFWFNSYDSDFYGYRPNFNGWWNDFVFNKNKGSGSSRLFYRILYQSFCQYWFICSAIFCSSFYSFFFQPRTINTYYQGLYSFLRYPGFGRGADYASYQGNEF